MKTQRRTLRGIVTSSLLTMALACGMMPAASLAFAAEAIEQDVTATEQGSDATAAAEEAISAEEAAADASAPADQDAAEPADIAADAPVATSTPAYTTSNPGHTAADVVLTQGSAEPAAGTIEYAGIAYTIDPDDPQTAIVTGLATDKPKGDVQIQPQVASDGKFYTVTGIEIVRGGVHR